MDRSELLIRYGFIKKDKKSSYYLYKENDNDLFYKPVEGYKPERPDEDADNERREVNFFGDKGFTGYPTPIKYYHLGWEVYDLSLEEPYYWILDVLKDYFSEVIKIEDTFAAAENSAFFGVTQQRLGAQQDKISQYLATTGKMIKELFQMVRELRIIDERLGYYKESEEQLRKPVEQRGRTAEIVLKGMFVDLVQGGGKSAASVYGMARELEFITLPDLFFDAPPFKSAEELKHHIESLSKDFNRNVTRVLERHLGQYMEWKSRTYKEHLDRREFMLKYLRQHFDIIKMYVAWVKPYLKHVQRLTLRERERSPDIISAFEGSLLDIEFLAKKPMEKAEEVFSCILVTFNYRTRPELKVVQEGYQRGPVHIGKMEMTLRVYAWTKQQIELYMKMKDKEIFEMMGDISESVHTAMISLGEELDKYLQEAQNATKKEAAASPGVKKSLSEKLWGEFYTPRKKSGSPSGKSVKQLRADEAKKEAALKDASFIGRLTGWNTYNNFKKAHRMVTW